MNRPIAHRHFTIHSTQAAHKGKGGGANGGVDSDLHGLISLEEIDDAQLTLPSTAQPEHAVNVGQKPVDNAPSQSKAGKGRQAATAPLKGPRSSGVCMHVC